MHSLTGSRILYPDSDGKPLAENTLQFEWIVTLKGGLEVLFADQPNVFVAGDLLWYPVEGEPTIRQAPDVLVALGRPKGYRGSYRQWEEDGIAPQVVIEVLSPGNRPGEQIRKFRFYERYGVEEYYIYDPDEMVLEGWLRKAAGLEEIPGINNWTSPRLGVRFETGDGDMRVYRPDGRRFETYVELAEARGEEEKKRMAAERARGEEERKRLAAERELERLRAQLRSLGHEPDA